MAGSGEARWPRPDIRLPERSVETPEQILHGTGLHELDASKYPLI
jgi:hypothetical protein